MNNDELQKAIDDITRDSSAPAAAAPAAEATTENDQLADELEQQVVAATAAVPAPAPAPEVDLGVAPAPVVPETPSMPPAPAAQPAAAPATPVVEEEAAVVEEPAPKAEVEEVSEEPVAAPAAEATTTTDNSATLEEALRELYPLLDKVEMPVEDKFEITMRVGEPSKALEYAKKIADDATKAKALLDIVEKLR